MGVAGLEKRLASRPPLTPFLRVSAAVAWTIVAGGLVYVGGGAGVVALLMTAAILVAVAQQTLP